MATLSTSHILDINNSIGNAGKDILAKNVTLRKSADDMFARLNITFSDEMTKHQLLMSLGVGGISADGVAISGMMTREVFEQSGVLKWTFKAYNMASRYVSLGLASDIEQGLDLAKLDIGEIIQSSIVAAMAVAISFGFARFLAGLRSIGTYTLGDIFGVVCNLVGFVMIQLALFIALEAKEVSGYIVNDSDEDLTGSSAYLGSGVMKLSPSPHLPERHKMTYMDDKKEMVEGIGVSVTLFYARKSMGTVAGTVGAISYQSSDLSKTYIFDWDGTENPFGAQNFCNVASSGTGEELVKNIGNLHKASKSFPTGEATCEVSASKQLPFYAKFAYWA